MSSIPEREKFRHYSRSEWKMLRSDTLLTIAEEDINALHGQIETVSIAEIEDVYMPLTRILNLLYSEKQKQYNCPRKIPFLIGVTGGVSVGKSTTSRAIKTLLERWESKPKVQIVTTDGFLFPNFILQEKGIMDRKGFPESFDKEAITHFLLDLRSGKNHLQIPIYSHQTYDILSDNYQTIESPDIVILEGVNILHIDTKNNFSEQSLMSDQIDFSIYVDADTEDVKEWFVERFMLFREKAKNNKSDFYYKFSKMLDEEAIAFAGNIWKTINEVNLNDHILPFKSRANLVLVKGENHQVKEVLLRKLYPNNFKIWNFAKELP